MLNPSDWVAPSMEHVPHFEAPFRLDGDAAACDLRALVAFPGKGKPYEPLRVIEGADPSNEMRAMLLTARDCHPEPVDDIASLGISDEHTARLQAAGKVLAAIEPNRIYFHAMDTTTGELEAYGVIFKGGQGA